MSGSLNGFCVQDVQHLLSPEDRDEILVLLGYRLVLDHEQQFFGRVIARVYPFWSGDGSGDWVQLWFQL